MRWGSLIGVPWALSLMLQGCVADEAKVVVRVAWPSGTRPDFQAQGVTPYVRTKFSREGALLVTTQSEPVSTGRLLAPQVPHTDQLIARVEILDGPWLNAQLLYEGESAPFHLEAGARFQVTVTLAPVAPRPTVDPDELDLSSVRFERSPWGRLHPAEAGGQIEALVEGSPGAAPEGAVEVVVFDGRDVARSTLLARQAIDSDGSFRAAFPRSLSNESDRVAVAFVDERMQLTDTSTSPGVQAAWVRQVRWFANLRNKVAGSSFPNPHQLTLARARRSHTWVDPELRLEVNAETLAAAVQPDGVGAEAVATPRWTAISLETPPPRFYPQLAYDEPRGDLVLFGGTTAGFRSLDDLWRWTNTGWREVEVTGDRPAGRRSAVFSYHRRLGSHVLFGGFGDDLVSPRALGDLWQLSGARWSPIETHGETPVARAGAAHAYDTQRGELVLFGGCTATEGAICTGLLRDLWGFDGQRWQRLSTSGFEPSARHEAAMAYDEAEDQFLLIGGEGANGAFSEDILWALSMKTMTWSPIEVGADGPPPQRDPRAAFDPKRRWLLIGSGVKRSELEFRPEPAGLWAWDGTRWWQPEGDVPSLANAGWVWHAGLQSAVSFGGSIDPLSDAQASSVVWDGERPRVFGKESRQPSNIYGGAAADPERSIVVLFGGFEGNGAGFAEGTWLFDGVSWRRRALPGPQPRFGPAMAYFPPLEGVLLVGGIVTTVGGSPQGSREAWLFDGEWRAVPFDGVPTTGAYSGSLAYDEQRQRLLGIDCRGVISLRWAPSQRLVWSTESGGPSPRFDATLVFDPEHNRTLVIGGRTCSRPRLLDEVWALDGGGSWTMLDTPPGFLARRNAVAVYDAGRSVIVLHGGQNGDSAVAILDDLWELSGTSWVRPALLNGSPRRTGHVGVYDRLRGKILLAAGLSFNGDSSFQLYDGNSFEPLTVPNTPGPLCAPAATYRPIARQGVLFGGCANAPTDFASPCRASSGTWLWSGFDWRPLVSDDQPEQRGFATMVVNPATDDVFLIGGRDNQIIHGTVWTLSGEGWRRAAPPILPSFGGAAAWDPISNGVLGVGGFAIDAFNQSTHLAAWSWNPLSGFRLSGLVPSQRLFSAMAYDPIRDEHVAQGGALPTGLPSEETCVRRQGEWTCSTLEGPSARQDATMTFDTTRGRVMLMGGASTSGGILRDTWEWTGGAWRKLLDGGFAHSQGAAFYDGERRGIVAYGGNLSIVCNDETTFLDLDPDTRPEIRFAVDFAVTRESSETIERIEVELVAGGRGYDFMSGLVAPAQPGVQLEGWDVGRSEWRLLGNLPHDLDSEEAVIVEIESPSALVGADGFVSLRLVPSAGNGSGLEPSVVRLDAIEARFDYTWE